MGMFICCYFIFDVKYQTKITKCWRFFVLYSCSFCLSLEHYNLLTTTVMMMVMMMMKLGWIDRWNMGGKVSRSALRWLQLYNDKTSAETGINTDAVARCICDWCVYIFLRRDKTDHTTNGGRQFVYVYHLKLMLVQCSLLRFVRGIWQIKCIS